MMSRTTPNILIFIVTTGFISMVGCHSSDRDPLQESLEEGAHVVELRNGALIAHFADNEPLPEYDDYPEGLNGIARLRHISRPGRDIFEPSQAGLNFEVTELSGVIDWCWRQTAEPRYAPMEIRRIDDVSVELYQAPTPRKQIEALLTFTLVEAPPAVDFTFQFRLHRAPRYSSWGTDLSVLFASYMYDPEDPTLYFIGHTTENETSRWLRANAVTHGEYWVEEADGTGQYTPAEYSIDRPYFAGTVDEFLFMIMVDPAKTFSLWYSPNGGWEREYNSPAWDLSLNFFDAPSPPDWAQARGRLLLLPGGTLDDAPAAYEAWLEEL